jgi:hypothetical protein
MEICTIFDKNYLAKGLCLYKSIKNNNILLNILCIDEFTFLKLSELKLEKIKLYNLKKLEEENQDLFKLKNSSHKTEYGDSYSNYCWALTPFFCNYLLKNKEIESLLYVDSDIYFYENFDSIKEEVSDHSVGIVTHRTDYHLTKETNSGKYNVGIVYFKSDEIGIKCSEFWKNLLMNPNNEYYSRYGTCGDQKYLELFEIKFDNICIIDKLVGHGAPWCFESYEYLDKYTIMYNGMKQKMVYNHFSHFKIGENGWESSYGGEWKPETINRYVKEYYEDYYKEIMDIKKKYNI